MHCRLIDFCVISTEGETSRVSLIGNVERKLIEDSRRGRTRIKDKRAILYSFPMSRSMGLFTSISLVFYFAQIFGDILNMK